MSFSSLWHHALLILNILNLSPFFFFKENLLSSFFCAANVLLLLATLLPVEIDMYTGILVVIYPTYGYWLSATVFIRSQHHSEVPVRFLYFLCVSVGSLYGFPSLCLVRLLYCSSLYAFAFCIHKFVRFSSGITNPYGSSSFLHHKSVRLSLLASQFRTGFACCFFWTGTVSCSPSFS